MRGLIPVIRAERAAAAAEALAKQVNPPEGFKLSATYGDIGPQLSQAGAINAGKFVQVYQASNRPLSDEQLGILRQNTQAPIVINQGNANNAYRPCCGNPTSFPDCNHGMALLGLLELMAAQGATVDQMFTAAIQVNAFWFPDQTLELATYFKAVEGKDFKTVNARRIVGKEFSSGSGFQQVHRALASNGLLPQSPGKGQSCGV